MLRNPAVAALAGAVAGAVLVGVFLRKSPKAPAAQKDDKKKEEAKEDAPVAVTPPSTTYPASKLHAFSKAVFMHFGCPEEHAQLAADVLQSADLRGIDSHGVARLHTYFELLQVGRINPTPKIKIVKETDSTATVDGDNGLGLVVGPRANQIALEKAKKAGSGFVAVCNTNHYGIAGYYSIEAAKQGCIGMSMTNTTKLVAPHWGAERMLGTNPIAIAIPAGEEPPVVCDLATSVVAYGKVEIAQRLNKKMPLRWCIDKEGQLTDDPARMKDGGALLTLGSDDDGCGHKGYCLSSWVDIMTAVLSGANWGPHAPPFTLRGGVNAGKTGTKGKGIGHFFGAWRTDAFIPNFGERMDEWITTFRATKPQAGKKVLIPGDPERLAHLKRAETGVPLTQRVIEDLQDISKQTGIEW